MYLMFLLIVTVYTTPTQGEQCGPRDVFIKGEDGLYDWTAAVYTIPARCTELDLRAYHLEDDGAVAVAIALESNTRVIRVSFGWNNISDIGAKAISKMIAINAAIKVIWLNNNQITNKGMGFIADALSNNTVVEKLDLQYNNIGIEGALALESVLKTNNTSLNNLRLWSNDDIPKELSNKLGSLAKMNRTTQNTWMLLWDRFEKFDDIIGSVINGLIIGSVVWYAFAHMC